MRKGNSVQEACAKCFAVHILKFEIFQTTWKKQNKKHQNDRFIDEKLKTKSLMFFVSFVSCDLQDFKFWYLSRKAIGASFLYRVDITQCVSLGGIKSNWEELLKLGLMLHLIQIAGNNVTSENICYIHNGLLESCIM